MCGRGPGSWAIRDDRTLSPNAKLVWLILSTRGDDCRPSLALIAADCGFSRSTAKRALAELDAGGWLTRTQARTEERGNLPNRYVLQAPPRATSEPPLGPPMAPEVENRSLKQPPGVAVATPGLTRHNPGEETRRPMRSHKAQPCHGEVPLFPVLPVPDSSAEPPPRKPPPRLPRDPLLRRAHLIADACVAAEPLASWLGMRQLAKRILSDGRWPPDDVADAFEAVAAEHIPTMGRVCLELRLMGEQDERYPDMVPAWEGRPL